MNAAIVRVGVGRTSVRPDNQTELTGQMLQNRTWDMTFAGSGSDVAFRDSSFCLLIAQCSPVSLLQWSSKKKCFLHQSPFIQ